MKLISLEEIKAVIEAAPERPDIYYVPAGRLLSPAAKDYLNANCIRFDNEKRRPLNEQRSLSTKYLQQNYTSRSTGSISGNHGDLTTGSGIQTNAGYGVTPRAGGGWYYRAGAHTQAATAETPSKMRFGTAAGNGAQPVLPTSGKPEAMTHTYGNQLVFKDDPVIQFRGKLDSAQAQVVFVQSLIAGQDGCPHLLADLQDVLDSMRDVMRAEVLGEPLQKETVLGLTHEELRAQSHDPEKYFHVKQMRLPSYEMGSAYAGLNLVRTTIREAEVLAVHAFREEATHAAELSRPDLVEQLNRLSSAVHILMCKYLAGYYTKK